MNQNLFEKLRPGAADCPSELALDKWIAEALTAAEQRSITVHVSRCELCEERIELRRLGLAAFPLIDETREIAALQRRLADASGPIRPEPIPIVVCETVSQRNRMQ